MNRNLLFLVVLSFNVNLLGGETPYKPIFTRKESKSSMMTGVVNTGRALKATYTFLNSNLDYMLTNKGCKKTIMILIPFVLLYARYYRLHPVKDVAKELLKTAGRAEAYYVIQKKLGQNEQLIQEISEQPWDMFCMAAIEMIKNLISKIKIPFIN